MMIVMIIIGILAIVLTESYLTISRVALKIEQEKNLSEESLVLTQIFQAIADEATIDYDAYGGKLKNSD
jgi:type II secretory pathway pseudopilin PulG